MGLTISYFHEKEARSLNISPEAGCRRAAQGRHWDAVVQAPCEEKGLFHPSAYSGSCPGCCSLLSAVKSRAVVSQPLPCWQTARLHLSSQRGLAMHFPCPTLLKQRQQEEEEEMVTVLTMAGL